MSYITRVGISCCEREGERGREREREGESERERERERVFSPNVRPPSEFAEVEISSRV